MSIVISAVCCLGVVCKRATGDEVRVGVVSRSNPTDAIVYHSDGSIHHSIVTKRCSTFGNGTNVVTVKVDMVARAITFLLNDEVQHCEQVRGC